MPKRLFTILFFLLLVPGLVLSQTKSVKTFQKKIVNDNVQQTNVAKSNKTYNPEAGTGESIGVTTNYDYFSNSIIRDQIIYANGTPNLANMIRPFPGDPDPTVRHVTYSYKDTTTGTWQNVDVFGEQSGWPQIDAQYTGSAPGTIAIVGHTTPSPFPSYLAIWDGSSFTTSEFDPATDPSVEWSGDNIFLATSGNRAIFKFYKTTDFGVSFTQFDSIANWTPTPIFWMANGGVEVGMSKSPNEMNLGYFGTNANAGEVYNGISPDSADNAWLIYTNDAGATWNGMVLAVDGQFDEVPNYHTPNYAPIIENFGQIDATVGNDGIWHVVANGYGPIFNATHDTSNTAEFPMLYWNSSTNVWQSISDPHIDSLQMDTYNYPGNDLGQCYPGIGESEDGTVLFATWTGPQLDANGDIDTVGAGGTYWLDVYYAYSMDAGSTWTYGGALLNDPTVSECFAHPAQKIRIDANNHYVADIVYLVDLVPGTSVFSGGGAESDNPIMYMTYDLGAVTAVGNNNNLVNSYKLSQNYPNPFNPTTTIKYTIASRENVTLKVYDILGNEVATLLNSTQEAGEHQINFDATKLASGVYIYKIKAGSFVQSKKMMLLK